MPNNDMVYLRATQKMLRRLPPPEAEIDRKPGNALGDWFVNRLVVDRQPLLILVSGTSLLPILEPARDVRSLPGRLPVIVRRRLERFGVPGELIVPEIEAMGEVLVAPTNDRSVVGTMVDFTRAVPYYLPEGVHWGERELHDAEAALAGTPCRSSGRNVLFPDLATTELLSTRWTVEAGGSLTSEH